LASLARGLAIPTGDWRPAPGDLRHSQEDQRFPPGIAVPRKGIGVARKRIGDSRRGLGYKARREVSLKWPDSIQIEIQSK